MLCHEGLKPSEIPSQKKSTPPPNLKLLMSGVGSQQVETTESQHIFNVPCSCVFPGPCRELVILLSVSKAIIFQPCHVSCLSGRLLPRSLMCGLGSSILLLSLQWCESQHVAFTYFNDSMGLRAGTAHCLKHCRVLSYRCWKNHCYELLALTSRLALVSQSLTHVNHWAHLPHYSSNLSLPMPSSCDNALL